MFANPAEAFVPNPGITLTGGQDSVDCEDSYNIGCQFSPTKILAIDALGVYGNGSSGLIGTYGLGFWKADQTLLPSASVSGVGDSTADQFVWKKLPTAVTIFTGAYVVAAADTCYDSYEKEGT